jgi:Protein of unknown function (DUF1176)
MIALKESPMQNMKYLIPLFLLLSSAAVASEVKGMDFEHEDWEVACDNTRTCRAAGYQADGDGSDEEPLPVSVLFTRAAGPHTPVSGKVRVDGDDPIPSEVELRIDGKALGKVSLDKKEAKGKLSAPQVQALLSALRHTSRIEFVAGKRIYRLSGAGASAVLLKMDDFQGRVGTPGALVRKGSKPESSVLQPMPAPLITVPKLDPPQPGDKALAADKSGALHRALQHNLREALKGKEDTEGCDEFNSKSELSVSRLTGGKLLVSAECWMAAYNDGSGYWVIEDHAPFRPVFVTTQATSDQNGIITSTQKGRGVADCLGFEVWYWTGSRFVHGESGTTGQCKGIGGGAWIMPTLVQRGTPAWSWD